ncbi:MAG: glucosamine kinase [Yoonia sp.]|jgi:glucosamine kinase
MNDSSHNLIIGVDGGGTGCRAAVGTITRGIFGRGEGGRANAATDLPLAIKSITDAVDAAAQQAQISTGSLSEATVHIGIAGVLTAQDGERIAAALPYRHIKVSDDRPTAVIGALAASNGALLSIGTGTIVALRSANDMAFVGGWGFQVSDQGSGSWLGRAALERVLLCHDRMSDHTHLTRKLFLKFDDDPNAIAAFAASATPGDFAVFARDVIAHAKDGDLWGQSMMQSGADHLVHALATLGFVPGQRLCMTGGVGPHYRQFLPHDYIAGHADAYGTSLDGAFALAKSHLTHQEETQ